VSRSHDSAVRSQVSGQPLLIVAEQCPYLSGPDRAPWRAGLTCARSLKIRELGAGSLSSAVNAASRDASLDPRGSHRFLRASLRGYRSVACGVTLVCTLPLSVSAGQRLPGARTPPGHELEHYYQGWVRISVRSPARPFGPSFPRGSLAHSRAWLPHSRKAAPGGLRFAHNPC
jgi:hypothetical protein